MRIGRTHERSGKHRDRVGALRSLVESGRDSDLGDGRAQCEGRIGGMEPDEACLDELGREPDLAAGISEGAAQGRRRSMNAAQESETAASAAQCSCNDVGALNFSLVGGVSLICTHGANRLLVEP